MISVDCKGDFKDTVKFLNSAQKKHDIEQILHRYGEEGVRALSSNTPVDSGKTAAMWGYELHFSKGRYSIYWTNDNINDQIPIAILIQYGHGTSNGGYVQGIDYINPALKKVFSTMTDELWREVVGK